MAELLHHHHNIPTAGNLGVDKTAEKLKQTIYWPSKREYIRDICCSCDKYFARKPKVEKSKTPMGTYITGKPMEKVALDILGPLPETEQQNKYILVIYFHKVDRGHSTTKS